MIFRHFRATSTTISTETEPRCALLPFMGSIVFNVDHSPTFPERCLLPLPVLVLKDSFVGYPTILTCSSNSMAGLLQLHSLRSLVSTTSSVELTDD